MSTRLDRIRLELHALEFPCTHHPLSALRPWLSAHGVVTAASLRTRPSGCRVRLSGLLILIHTPPTRSGKRVLFVTLEDETGLWDLAAFPDSQAHSAHTLYSCEVITAEGILKREGAEGRSISVTLRRALPELSGSLNRLLTRAELAPSGE